MHFQHWKNAITAAIVLTAGTVCGWAENRCDRGFHFDGSGYNASVSNTGLVVRPANRTQPVSFRLLHANADAAPAREASTVRYANVYPGVDLVYYKHNGNLEYDFAVAPGLDPSVIAFSLEGDSGITLGEKGELLAATRGGQVRLDAPVIYQTGTDGRRQIIEGGYRLSGNRVSFRIGNYDRSKTLIIDPVISYSTYVGNSGDSIMAATADSAGNAYLVGRAAGLILLQKLNPTGTTVLLRQSIGTVSYNFNVETIAVSSAGKIYLAGYAGTGLPTTANAYLGTITSGSHAFVAVL